MLTVEEIVTGLEMNVAGLLGEVTQHYQLFSVEYVTNVINKFLNYKYEVMKDFTNKFGEARQLNAPKKATPEQCYKSIKKHFEQTGQVPVTADWSAAFDWMWSNKLLEIEELKTFMEVEKPKYISSIKNKLATCTNSIERGIIELEMSDESVKYHLRKKYLTEKYNWK